MSEMFDYIWAQKYRPKHLKDIVLSPSHRSMFEGFIKEKQIPNLLLSGNPGVGKSSCSKVLVNELECDSLYINASDETGIDTIRYKVKNFSETRSFNGGIKIVILDEADGLGGVISGSKSSAQQALRNVMEEYSQTTRFILTANYPSKIIPALHSRCQQIELAPPFDECVKFCVNILKQENVQIAKEQKPLLLKLIKSRYPDMRKIINSLQQNTVDGKLVIQDDAERLHVAEKVFKLITNKKPIEDIRAFVIQSETEFGDYHDFLTDMFEVIFKSDIEQKKKAPMMLVITEAMYRHNIVMDQEINAYSAIIQLSQIV
jgi:DNA polymerase III delta prime subunit